MSFLKSLEKRPLTIKAVAVAGVGTAHVRRMGVRRIMLMYGQIADIASMTSIESVDAMTRAVACFLCDAEGRYEIADPEDIPADSWASLQELGEGEIAALFNAGLGLNTLDKVREESAKN